MVEVFKTDINNRRIADVLLSELQELYPDSKISFDLEDCDNILRIESEHTIFADIKKLLSGKGFDCLELE